MSENITVKGNPNNSVFGVIGANTSTDEGNLYVKISDDSRNVGWKKMVPPPTQTILPSPTPTKTFYPTRTALPTSTPTSTPTPTPTIPTITPTPRTSINYTISSTSGGSATRTDGPTPTGTINVGTGTMNISATISSGYRFNGWTATSGVNIENQYSLNTVASGFNTYEDVTITANFQVGLLPMYYINGYAGPSGRLNFYFINSYGYEQQYFSSGLSPGVLMTNITCGNRITRIVDGYAYITSNLCGSIPPTSTPYPTATSTPSPTPSATATPTPTPSITAGGSYTWTIRMLTGGASMNVVGIGPQSETPYYPVSAGSYALNSTSAPGYFFTGYTVVGGSVSSGDAITTLTITGNGLVTGNWIYIPNTPTPTSSPSPTPSPTPSSTVTIRNVQVKNSSGGLVAGIGPYDEEGNYYTDGAVHGMPEGTYNVFAAPLDGYQFKQWVTESGNSVVGSSITITQNTVIRADFEQLPTPSPSSSPTPTPSGTGIEP